MSVTTLTRALIGRSSLRRLVDRKMTKNSMANAINATWMRLKR